MTRKILSRACYLTAFTAIFVAFVVTGVSFVLRDLKYYTERSFAHLQVATGYRITMDAVSWSFDRGAGIAVTNLQVSDRQGKQPLFSCKQLSLVPELLPLLSKKIRVSKLVMVEPEAFVDRKRFGSAPVFDRQTVLLRKQESDEGIFDFTVSLESVFVRKGSLRYHDSLMPVEVDLENINISLLKNAKAKGYRISAAAAQPLSRGQALLELDGNVWFSAHRRSWDNLEAEGCLTIKKLNLSSLQPFLDITKAVAVQQGLVNADFSFRLRPQLHLSTSGTLDTAGFQLVLPNMSRISTDTCRSTFDLQWDGASLRCENLQVSLDENIVMAGSFNLEVPQTAPSRFNINIVTDPINISALHKYRDVLLPRAQGLFRTIESGTLQIEDFRYQCRLGDAEESSGPAVSGRLSLRNITAVPGCALPGIHLKDGVLTLDGDTLKGSLAGTWLEADSHAASISVQSLYDNPLYSLKLESALPAAPLNTVLQQVSVTTAAADVLRMLDGTVKITTRITNTPGGRIVSDFDLTDASYGVLNSVVKPVGMINRLQLNSEFDAAAPIKFNFLIQDSLKFAGRVDKQQFSRVSGSYLLKDVVLDDFTFPELPPPLCVTGRLNGKGTFAGAADSATASLSGRLRLDGFSICEEDRSEPYVAVSCAVDLQDNGTLIESGSARVGATRFSFAGTLETLVPPQGKLTVDAAYFDIDDFVATVKSIMRLTEKPPSVEPDAAPSVFKRTALDIDLRVRKVNFLDWDGTEARSHYLYTNGAMLWDEITLSAGQGTLEGSVLYDFSLPHSKVLELKPTRTNVDFDWFVPGLRQGKTITGRMDLSGIFSSTFKKRSEIIPNMTGAFHVVVVDGTIRRLSVLSKILSLLNIRQLLQLKVPDFLSQGMPYDVIESDLIMEQGVMQTENIRLQSPAMNLTAVGHIDAVKGTLDLTVGAQILPTISMILGNIPIAGEIVTGKDKSLTIGYFSIVGDYKNPTVKIMPMKSLSSKVLGIFKAILDIPKELIN